MQSSDAAREQIQQVTFTSRDLAAMIVPLFLEQFLLMLVGLADTFFVSKVGEAAVAGVSLVNQFNTIFIYLFTALAAGGAVVVSQYVGTRNHEQAGRASSQLLMFSVVFSLAMSAVVLVFGRQILHVMFGNVETGVMEACVTYLNISAVSYPMLAVYNAGAALFRSIGKTNVTMWVSVASNIVNVLGNYVGVFVLGAGVAGVAWPSTISRLVAAVLITVLAFREKTVRYRVKDIFTWDTPMLKRVLGIAIPNGPKTPYSSWLRLRSRASWHCSAPTRLPPTALPRASDRLRRWRARRSARPT